MDLKVLQIHKHPQYLHPCCRLINEEWKRSDTARLHSLQNSSDNPPTSLILLQDSTLIGHLKLSPIPSVKNACFVESVVIDRKLRGKGYGSYLMREAESYCKGFLGLDTLYLSTKGQEGFYGKLGYVECGPVSIYGSYVPKVGKVEGKGVDLSTGPTPPPLPVDKSVVTGKKVYMKKELM